MLSAMFAPVLYTFLCPSVNIFYNPLEYALGFRSLLLSQKQLRSPVVKGTGMYLQMLPFGIMCKPFMLFLSAE